MKVEYTGKTPVRVKKQDFYPGEVYEVADDLKFDDKLFKIKSESKSETEKPKTETKKSKTTKKKTSSKKDE